MTSQEIEVKVDKIMLRLVGWLIHRFPSLRQDFQFLMAFFSEDVDTLTKKRKSDEVFLWKKNGQKISPIRLATKDEIKWIEVRCGLSPKE